MGIWRIASTSKCAMKKSGLALRSTTARTASSDSSSSASRLSSTNSWIDNQVFPGAYIPELSDVIKSIERSQMNLCQVFTHNKENYFQTLQAWTENFYRNYDKLESVLAPIVSKGNVAIIMRIWEFYLCSSRLVFNRDFGYCYNVQILLSKSNDQTGYQ